jgi:hypothetical protein
MRVLDKEKILDFMKKRKDGLYHQVTQDFAGGLEGRLYMHNEVKFWKEAVERGEFDGEIPEVYVILCSAHNEIVDFTFYTDENEISRRVDQLNELSKNTKYWYITMYSNSRNSEKDGKTVPKNI